MGTDTMAYAASALSFMLENLGKTVGTAAVAPSSSDWRFSWMRFCVGGAWQCSCAVWCCVVLVRVFGTGSDGTAASPSVSVSVSHSSCGCLCLPLSPLCADLSPHARAPHRVFTQTFIETLNGSDLGLDLDLGILFWRRVDWLFRAQVVFTGSQVRSAHAILAV